MGRRRGETESRHFPLPLSNLCWSQHIHAGPTRSQQESLHTEITGSEMATSPKICQG